MALDVKLPTENVIKEPPKGAQVEAAVKRKRKRRKL